MAGMAAPTAAAMAAGITRIPRHHPLALAAVGTRGINAPQNHHFPAKIYIFLN